MFVAYLLLYSFIIKLRIEISTFQFKRVTPISVLQKSIEKKLFFWKDKNATLTQDFCHNLLERLKNEHLDPVLKRVGGPDGAKVSYGEIMGGWSKIKTDFTSKAVGAKDVMADVFFKYNQVRNFPLVIKMVSEDATLVFFLCQIRLRATLKF